MLPVDRVVVRMNRNLPLEARPFAKNAEVGVHVSRVDVAIVVEVKVIAGRVDRDAWPLAQDTEVGVNIGRIDVPIAVVVQRITHTARGLANVRLTVGVCVDTGRERTSPSPTRTCTSCFKERDTECPRKAACSLRLRAALTAAQGSNTTECAVLGQALRLRLSVNAVTGGEAASTSRTGASGAAVRIRSGECTTNSNTVGLAELEAEARGRTASAKRLRAIRRDAVRSIARVVPARRGAVAHRHDIARTIGEAARTHARRTAQAAPRRAGHNIAGRTAGGCEIGELHPAAVWRTPSSPAIQAQKPVGTTRLQPTNISRRKGVGS